MSKNYTLFFVIFTASHLVRKWVHQCFNLSLYDSIHRKYIWPLKGSRNAFGKLDYLKSTWLFQNFSNGIRKKTKHPDFVSILGLDSGYTMKYGFSSRDFLKDTAWGNWQGLRPYFESSPNTEIISFRKVSLRPFPVFPSEVGYTGEFILRMYLSGRAILHRIFQRGYILKYASFRCPREYTCPRGQYWKR